MLIGEDGNKLGLKTKEDALQSSSELNLDLVQVSPKGTEPVVCKIMDFGKHIFMKKKSSSSSKSGSRLGLKILKESSEVVKINVLNYGWNRSSFMFFYP